VIVLNAGIWGATTRVIDRCPNVAALRYHGLAAIAAVHRRATSDEHLAEVDADLAQNAAAGLQGLEAVRAVREVVDGPLLLMKGLDVARLYPDPSLRRLRDVDMLVSDPDGTQWRLICAGFRETRGPGVEVDSRDRLLHQLCPLQAPGLWIPVEIHRTPHWPFWCRPPSYEELIGDAEPSTVALDDVVTPRLEHHALIVLAHAWAGQPFEQFAQLLDVAVLLEKCDARDVVGVARRWRLERALDVARATIDCLLHNLGRVPFVTRHFAAHLETLAIPSPARRQFDRYASSVFVTSPAEAAVGGARAAARRARVLLR
jgi:hypothetical protein